ncbi:F-box [Glarea lozoyensis ATCC 20868]|uniref:F-box n=1 Tax=Glarea lozoyensis (strain ATCC 20868 / MF5171) TaxID=1116229 RepID=S3CW97_GLAL2|nr:F-box [Glarea lozoyensis ATCC 20868]EPE29204.1 F-box [Glarea lozoyensis ATCC 20868]
MNLVELPNDLFLLIVAYLSPRDLILCRRVSRQFCSAFREDELNRHALLKHFPRARELRGASVDGWAELFSKVASRYHYLRAGKPRGIEKIAVAKSWLAPEWSSYYPIGQWQRELAFEGKRARFHYAETLWTYDDGYLVYPSASLKCYVVHDLESGTRHEIDIESKGKIVRRLRLKSQVLIVEWSEREAYHQLNETEEVHRHFATAYDIQHDLEDGKIRATFRYLVNPTLISY